MNKEEILKIAKQKYPNGTKFKCVNNNNCYTSSNIIDHDKFKFTESHNGVYKGNFWIYLKKQWATIISTPIKIYELW